MTDARPWPSLGLARGAWGVFGHQLRAEWASPWPLQLLLLALPPGLALLQTPVAPAAALAGDGPPAASLAFHLRYAQPTLHLLAAIVLMLRASQAREALASDAALAAAPIGRGARFLGLLAWIVAGGWAGLALSAVITQMVLATQLGGDLDTGYLAALLLLLGAQALGYGALCFALQLWLPGAGLIAMAYALGYEPRAGALPGALGWASLRVHAETRLLEAAPAYPELASASVSPLASLVAGAKSPPGASATLAAVGALVAIAMIAGAIAAITRDQLPS